MEMNILHMMQGLRNPILDKIMVCITTLGDAGALWIILSLILMPIKKYRKAGITMLVALVLSVLFGNVILKHLVARPRPCWVDKSVSMLVAIPKDFSFPSGHTSASFAAAAALFFYYRKPGIAALSVALLIGISRLYLFVHYPTDVAAGMVFGIICAAISFFIVKKCTGMYMKQL